MCINNNKLHRIVNEAGKRERNFRRRKGYLRYEFIYQTHKNVYEFEGKHPY